MKQKFINAYMDVAERFAQLSYAERLKVGCIIVKDNRIISLGYNGTPSGWDNCCEQTVPEIIDPDTRAITPQQLITKPEVLHAEMNALMKLARTTEGGQGSSMFITHAPCLECAKGIYQSGVATVYYKENYRSTQGVDFLNKLGVEVIHLHKPEELP